MRIGRYFLKKTGWPMCLSAVGSRVSICSINHQPSNRTLTMSAAVLYRALLCWTEQSICIPQDKGTLPLEVLNQPFVPESRLTCQCKALLSLVFSVLFGFWAKGLAAARFGPPKEVVITDLESHVDICTSNVSRDAATGAQARRNLLFSLSASTM